MASRHSGAAFGVAFRFGGMPYEVCERGLKLFAKEVLPVLKAQGPAEVKAAAE